MGAGKMYCMVPQSHAHRRAEEVLIVSFMCDRKLFGLAYWEVQPEYFDGMPRQSGVFIAPLVQTNQIIGHAQRPGDIDLLVIPYEMDELVLDRVLVMEVKAVRATFARQGKSPNEFGFSQAHGLLELGFPYVAVAHLIISDISPQEHWQEMMTAKILDDEGRVERLGSERMDRLPDTLTERSFGRLIKHRSVDYVGLVSAYIYSPIFGNCDPNRRMLHFPSGRPAGLNPRVDVRTLDAVAAYFEEHHSIFLDTPRYDPA